MLELDEHLLGLALLLVDAGERLIRVAALRVEPLGRAQLLLDAGRVVLALRDLREAGADVVAVVAVVREPDEQRLRLRDIAVVLRDLGHDVARDRLFRIECERGLRGGLRLVGVAGVEVAERDVRLRLRVAGRSIGGDLELRDVVEAARRELERPGVRREANLEVLAEVGVELRHRLAGDRLEHLGRLLALAEHLERLDDLGKPVRLHEVLDRHRRLEVRDDDGLRVGLHELRVEIAARRQRPVRHRPVEVLILLPPLLRT